MQRRHLVAALALLAAACDGAFSVAAGVHSDRLGRPLLPPGRCVAGGWAVPQRAVCSRVTVVHATALADDETLGDGEVLPVPPLPMPPATPSLFGMPLKYVVLLLLIFQNSVVSVATAATRSVRPLYLGSVAVLLSELVKLPVCVGLIVREQGSVRGMVQELRAKVVTEWTDTLRMGVPALCYCLQNLLFFVALSSLSATSYQLWSQSKTLFTALFFVTMLGKALSKQQWLALGLLSAGVGLVQTADMPAAAAALAGSPAALVGIAAVLTSSVLSGFANVYFEKVVKQSSVSLWVRNVQLGLFSIPQAAALMLADRALIRSQGVLVGFTPLVWLVVLLKAFGGLLVATVVKYADNVLKTYATAISIVLTCVFTALSTRTAPAAAFLQGMGLVLASIFLYNFGAPKPIPRTDGCSQTNLVRDRRIEVI